VGLESELEQDLFGLSVYCTPCFENVYHWLRSVVLGLFCVASLSSRSCGEFSFSDCEAKGFILTRARIIIHKQALSCQSIKTNDLYEGSSDGFTVAFPALATLVQVQKLERDAWGSVYSIFVYKIRVYYEYVQRASPRSLDGIGTNSEFIHERPSASCLVDYKAMHASPAHTT
jgi:hypothetical protein